MSDERAWSYCSICGRKIPVGEMCYGVKRNAALLFSGNTICKDCIAPENYEPEPSADVRPAVRGRWVRTRQVELNPSWSLENCGTQYKCSECGRRAGYKQVTLYKFCPNCGAEMKLG